MFSIFSILSLCAMIAYPILLIDVQRKIYNKKYPVVSYVLLIVCNCIFWVWILAILEP